MTTFTVTTLADERNDSNNLATETADGDGLSLREALGLASLNPGADLIEFAVSGTITLTRGQLFLGDVTVDGDVDGDNRADIAISGNNSTRIFNVGTNANATLNSLTLENASANSLSATAGAAINADNANTLTINHSTIQNNFAFNSGGGLSAFNTDVIISNSTFTGNHAGLDGGAIRLAKSTLIATNVTIHDNSTNGNGGGIYDGTSQFDLPDMNVITLINNTITDNRADADGNGSGPGGGGGGVSSFHGSLTVRNTVIASNERGAEGMGIADDSLGNVDSAENSFFSTTATISGSNNINGGGNPLLGALTENGGTVQTQAIQSGSQLIDAGSNALVPGVANDASGDARINGVSVDIGADEFFANNPPQFEGLLADGSETIMVNEDLAQGTVIFNADANNGDGGATDAGITFSIVGQNTDADGDGNQAFAINAATGEVSINDADDVDLDNGVSGSNTLTIVSDDGSAGDNSAEAELEIILNDLAETYTVDTLSDVDDGDFSAGNLSLREAVGLANNGASSSDTILFDSSLEGGTIILSSGELDITSGVTINGDMDGDGKADITLSGDDANRIFDISGTGTEVDLASLTMVDGYTFSGGGAVRSQNNTVLNILDSTISDSGSSYSDGGGIYSDGELNVVNSTITDNLAFRGGGIAVGFSGGALNVVNSTIHGNTGTSGGGIHGRGSATLVIRDSTITDNTAYSGGGGIYMGFGSAALVENSVIALNSAATAGTEDVGVESGYYAAPELTAGNSFFGSAVTIDTDDGGNINGGGNPLLGNLLDNGGTVLTRSPLDLSPLIDAGLNTLIPPDTLDVDGDGNTIEDLPLDGRGGLRIVSGDVDIGAVEQIEDETIRGTDEGDNIIGGLGTDVLAGLGGVDTLDGGAGNDTADFSASGSGVMVGINAGAVNSGGDAEGDVLIGIENLTGSGFDDQLTGNFLANVLMGGEGNDFLNGGARNDVLSGGDDDDILIGGNGADMIDGGDGVDTVSYVTGTGNIQANLTTGQATGVGQNVGDTLMHVENVTGTNADNGAGVSDFLTGNGEDNVLIGLGGNDRLFGMSGSDTLIGNADDDIMDGGADGDFLFGGAGNDLLRGGTGDDFLRGDGGTDRYSFEIANFGADTLIGFENGTELLDFRGSGLQFDDLTINNRATTTTVEVTGQSDFISLVGVLSGIDENDFIFDPTMS